MSQEGKKRFLLLYGSETGQAQAIAEEIYEAAPEHNLAPELHCLSATDKKFSLEKETCMVMIVSTTGEGDPPETAEKFWRRLKKKTLPKDHLAKLSYSLLALGDTNYTNFCANGKNFDKRLQELGATHFYETGYADDAVGLEIVTEPWIEGLWPALLKQLCIDETDSLAGHESRSSNLVNLSSDSENDKKGDSTDSSSSAARMDRDDSQDSFTPPQIINDPLEGGTPGMNSRQNSKDILRSSNTFINRNASNGEEENFKNSPSKQDNEDSPQNGSGISDIEGNRSNTDEVVASSGSPILHGNSVSVLSHNGSAETNGTLIEEVDAAPSLTCSVAPLCNSALTLPMLPASYLEVTYRGDLDWDEPEFAACSYPSAASEVSMATITGARRLTRHDAVKTTLELELDIKNSGLDFQPGDSFGIICPNKESEVSELIKLLNLDDKADVPFTLKVKVGTVKKTAAVPEFLPQPSTLRYAFRHCFDIRSTPKKAFVRMLAEYANDAKQKRRLQELCSKQGVKDFDGFIRKEYRSPIDILRAFPSCKPPIVRVLELLPRLLPRPYSIASSPLSAPGKIRFAFNIMDFTPTKRKASATQGVCTTWLDHLTSDFQAVRDDFSFEMLQNSKKFKLTKPPKIPIYLRTNQSFHLPEDHTRPIIMIGPGTGVAPFIGFLEHIRSQRIIGTNFTETNETWLFYGCRHKDRDYLYREELELFVTDGTLTHLLVSYSRDPSAESDTSSPKYVQDNMKLHAKELATLLLEQNAVVYVCGDADGMAKDVMETWTTILCEHTGKSKFEITVLLATVREEGRYLQDIWT